MKLRKVHIGKILAIILFCLGINTRSAAKDGPETLVASYSLKEARALLRFATKTCKLPRVRAMLINGGLGLRHPPKVLKLHVPQTFQTKASWYGGEDGFHGKPMANGELFDHNNPTTAASQFLPIGTALTVYWTYYQVEVVIKDRGTCKHGREIDLSRAAAQKLGIEKVGVVPVIATIHSLGHE